MVRLPLVIFLAAAGCAEPQSRPLGGPSTTTSPGSSSFAPEEAADLKPVLDLPPAASEQDLLSALRSEQRVSRMVPVVRRFVRNNTEGTFAGLYVTHEAGSALLNVGFTDAGRHHHDALLSVVEHPDQIRFFRAEFSYVTLTELDRTILRDWDDLSELGVEIVSQGVDEERNRVGIGIHDLDDEDRRMMQERYPMEMLVLFESERWTTGPELVRRGAHRAGHR